MTYSFIYFMIIHLDIEGKIDTFHIEEQITAVRLEMNSLSNSIRELAIDHNLNKYDIWTESGRSAVEQQEFKDSMIKYYKRNSWFGHKVRCMMTNEWHRRDHVIAEHIWKHKMDGNGLHKFNLQRTDAGSPRNGILMLQAIEDRFTIKHVCIVYDSIRKVFIIKVLNPDILTTVITPSNKTFGDIDGRKLNHPKNCIPFRRLLSFHARCAFKFAREKGWISVEQENLFMPFHDLSDTASVRAVD